MWKPIGCRSVSGRLWCRVILTLTPDVTVDSSHIVKGKQGFCQWDRKFLLPPAVLPSTHEPRKWLASHSPSVVNGSEGAGIFRALRREPILLSWKHNTIYVYSTLHGEVVKSIFVNNVWAKCWKCACCSVKHLVLQFDQQMSLNHGFKKGCMQNSWIMIWNE